MMDFKTYKSTIAKIIVGFFASLIILIPVSISVTQFNESEIAIAIQPNTAHALIPAVLGIGALTTGIFSLFNFKPATALVIVIGNTALNITSALTWFGGWLLEGSLKHLVFEMGAQLNGQRLGITIDTLWSLIRDMCNLFFIFGFIYTGFRTIIDPEGAETKRFISQIIIGALLINFSLFFVKIVIDFSNFLAFKIFAQMTTGSGSLSAAFADALGIISIFSVPSSEELSKITGGGALWFYFLAAIFLLVTAFVFIASAILLIVRFIALIFIMIFSPILFAATIFPQTNEYASDLWHKLFSYSFFAPIYLLLSLISLNILSALNFRQNDLGFVKELVAGAQATDSYSVVLKFSIALGFMIASLLTAQKLGVKGGEMAVSVGNNLRGRAQSALGRNTVGWASYKALHGYEKLDAKISGNKKANSIRKWGMRVANVATLGAAGGVINDRNITGVLHAGEHAKFGGSYSYEDDKKYDKEHKARQAKINELHALEEKIHKGIDAAASAADKIAMERAVSGASNDQILELIKEIKDENSNEYKALIANISTSQFDTLMKLKDDELDSAKRSKIAATRSAAIEARLISNTAGAVTIADAIGKADGKELDALDFNSTVLPNASRLSSKQIDDMGSLTTTSKNTLKEYRKRDLLAVFGGGVAGPGTVGGAVEIFTNRFKSDVERAKLPTDILKDPASIPYLNTNVLSKIISNESVTDSDRLTIRNQILATGTPEQRNWLLSSRGSEF